MGDDPSRSAYTWDSWWLESFTVYCQKKYGLTPKYNWALDFFGGRNPSKDFMDLTNMIWVNGEYDPWRGGGIWERAPTSKTVVLYIEKAAHHYDLRGENELDTP